MDGTFLDLAADVIEAELEEYSQELYKVHKIFLNRLKKSQGDKTDRSDKKKPSEESAETTDIRELQHVPIILKVIGAVQDHMKSFRVGLLFQPVFGSHHFISLDKKLILHVLFFLSCMHTSVHLYLSNQFHHVVYQTSFL